MVSSQKYFSQYSTRNKSIFTHHNQHVDQLLSTVITKQKSNQNLSSAKKLSSAQAFGKTQSVSLWPESLSPQAHNPNPMSVSLHRSRVNLTQLHKVVFDYQKKKLRQICSNEEKYFSNLSKMNFLKIMQRPNADKLTVEKLDQIVKCPNPNLLHVYLGEDWGVFGRSDPRQGRQADQDEKKFYQLLETVYNDSVHKMHHEFDNNASYLVSPTSSAQLSDINKLSKQNLLVQQFKVQQRQKMSKGEGLVHQ